MKTLKTYLTEGINWVTTSTMDIDQTSTNNVINKKKDISDQEYWIADRQKRARIIKDVQKIFNDGWTHIHGAIYGG